MDASVRNGSMTVLLNLDLFANHYLLPKMSPVNMECLPSIDAATTAYEQIRRVCCCSRRDSER
jgi:hypothetical protein